MSTDDKPPIDQAQNGTPRPAETQRPATAATPTAPASPAARATSGTPATPAAPAPAQATATTTVEKPAPGPKPAAAKPKRKPKNLAVIDQRGCTGCEWCIPICPVDAINLLPGDEHPLLNKLVEIDYDICIGCVLCSEICPWETIVRIPYDEALELAPKVTIRRYKDVPPEDRIEGKKW